MSDIEYEPAAIGAIDNARSFAHADIKSLAESLSPSEAMTSAFQWMESSTRVAEASAALQNAVARTIGATWTGAAAESAERGVAAYSDSVGDLAAGIAAMFMPLHNLSLQSVAFMAAVPAVVQSSPTDTSDTSAGAAEEEARDALHTLISTGFVESDRIVPTLPAPFDPILDDRTGGASSSPQSGATQAQSPARQTDSTPTGDSAADYPTQPPEQFANSTPGENVLVDSALPESTPAESINATTSDSSLPPATRQASYVDDSSSTPRSWLEDPIRRAGTPAPSVNASSPLTQLPVAPIVATQPGQPGTVASESNSVNRANPAASRTGMPGMMPGAASRQRDDDSEHAIPSYLVNAENGNELFGPIPKTAPPVLGA